MLAAGIFARFVGIAAGLFAAGIFARFVGIAAGLFAAGIFARFVCAAAGLVGAALLRTRSVGTFSVFGRAVSGDQLYRYFER